MKIIYLFVLIFIMFSCIDINKDPIQNDFCDCKELQYNSMYNVHHLGNPKEPFTGLCKDFYKGGKLKKENDYLNGKLDGSYKFYYSNGILKTDADYKIGLITGNYKEYDSEGTLIYHAIYNRNQISKIIHQKKY